MLSGWLNMEFMAKYAPLYVEAAGLTVKIAFWGILFSLIVGFFCSTAQYYRMPILTRLSSRASCCWVRCKL